MSVTNPGALHEYQQVGVFSGAAYADPHYLITMLMEGALERIALTKGAIAKGDVVEKSRLIGNAITIVEGLKGCLDLSVGGELAQNLADLYDYMTRRLLNANLNNDIQMLDEVASLLHEIKVAWQQIPQVHEKPKNLERMAVR